MRRFTALCISLGICIGSFAAEQTAPPRRAPGTGEVSRADATRFRPDPRFPQNLTPEQRVKVQEAQQKYRAAAAPIEARLRTARGQLDELITQEKLDEAAIRAKAQIIGDIEADLAIARAQHYAKLREVLPEEAARRLSNISTPRLFENRTTPALRTNTPPAPK